MNDQKSFFWTLPLLGVLFFVRCEGNLEQAEYVSDNGPIECFDYLYPIQVVFDGDTLSVSSFDHYKQLHTQCDEVFDEFTPGLDPKGRDSNNRIPTGKSHTTATSDPYGDCLRENDPWCGEMIFPLTIANVPGLEGEIEVPNDSTLQYYRWIVCD